MNTSYPTTNAPTTASATTTTEQTATNMASEVDEALTAGQRVMQDAAASIQDGLDSLRQSVSPAVSRLQTQTEAYVREQPVKAVLLAAAAGGLVAMLLGRSGRAR